MIQRFPIDIRNMLKDEIARFQRLPAEAPEYQNLKTYLEWASALPWKKRSLEHFNLARFEFILNKQHIGRTALKEKISEHFAVATLRKSVQGLVFGFVGPPGVGKLNLAHAIANGLGREFAEVSLSEMEDEGIFKGSRRDSALATPGKLLERLKSLGTRNPVIILKNINLPARDWSPRLINTFLHLFDPEHNLQFVDQYLGLPFDISDILFILTSLDPDNIPDPVRDCMQIFQLNAYTPEEKLLIAKKNLIPSQIKASGLQNLSLKIPEKVLTTLINNYTRESGVHRMEFLIGSLCRNIAHRVVKTRRRSFVIDDRTVQEVLGPPRYFRQQRESNVRPGIVTALSWTPLGGDILFVEVSIVPGSGQLNVTGQIGNVMRESAEIALSWARGHMEALGHKWNFKEVDVHIHVPQGATQKDGPSAGLTIVTALMSYLEQKSVDSSIAMTGEITLRGSILRIGGLKEKLIAAHRAGIKTVIIPKQNESDLSEMKREVMSELNIQTVDSIEQVLDLIFTKKKGKAVGR